MDSILFEFFFKTFEIKFVFNLFTISLCVSIFLGQENRRNIKSRFIITENHLES
jgi:hypothetical protein